MMFSITKKEKSKHRKHEKHDFITFFNKKLINFMFFPKYEPPIYVIFWRKTGWKNPFWKVGFPGTTPVRGGQNGLPDRTAQRPKLGGQTHFWCGRPFFFRTKKPPPGYPPPPPPPPPGETLFWVKKGTPRKVDKNVGFWGFLNFV